MRWVVSYRASPIGAALADRHYNRQSKGSAQFGPPGRTLVLLAGTSKGRALWVSNWQKEEYVKHQWPDSWVCSLFRNEGAGLSSELIREAVSATLWHWATPPDQGMITFVDPSKIKKKRDPGRCFRKAGFVEIGETQKRGRLVLQLRCGDMPAPAPPLGSTLSLPFPS